MFLNLKFLNLNFDLALTLTASKVKSMVSFYVLLEITKFLSEHISQFDAYF